jgi:hypothetical protein
MLKGNEFVRFSLFAHSIEFDRIRFNLVFFHQIESVKSNSNHIEIDVIRINKLHDGKSTYILSG